MNLSYLPAALLAWISLLVAALPGFGEVSGTSKGNRITHLDEPNNPWQFDRGSAKLITPQWIGEKGVEAVAVDMRQHRTGGCD